ncbi:MAG: c-type cytochrome [Arachidicoccus sp.]|nr:c-type cytochrome [Arachidicoccus sp.]
MKYRKKTIVLSVMVCLFVFTIMSFAGRRQPKHNFKILPQDISRDSLHNIMHSFNVALGVKCGFCHAKSTLDTTKLDFESDAKEEKEIARAMMTMTMEINKKYFSDPNFNPNAVPIVSCVTCHHGHEEPEKEIPSVE